MNLEASGPQEIRAAFTAAIDTTQVRAAEVGGIADVLGEAADRYETLKMASSTVGHLRDALQAFTSAQAALHGARDELQGALADFDSRDAQVADAVAEAGGNVAASEILLGDGGTPSPPAVERHRAPDPDRQEAAVADPSATAPTRHRGNPDQPQAANGRWTKEGEAEIVDVLDLVDEDICWGSDQVKGTGPVPTNLALMDYDPHKHEPGWGGGGQYVEVATPPPGARMSATANPNLSPDEAERAADHLDDLARLAEDGHQPPKPGRYAKAALRLQHMLDQDTARPGDRISVGEEEEFPLTARELLDLLRQRDPEGVTGAVRRQVVAKASADGGGEHGAVWMDLAPSPEGTRVAVTAIEGRDTPDDEYWKPYTAHHTPDQARELARKFRTFAAAARRGPAADAQPTEDQHAQQQ